MFAGLQHDGGGEQKGKKDRDQQQEEKEEKRSVSHLSIFVKMTLANRGHFLALTEGRSAFEIGLRRED